MWGHSHKQTVLNPSNTNGTHLPILLSSLQKFDGLMQERRNSSALAIELHLYCTNLQGFYLPKFQDIVRLKFWKFWTFPKFRTISVYVDVNFVCLWYTRSKCPDIKFGQQKPWFNPLKYNHHHLRRHLKNNHLGQRWRCELCKILHKCSEDCWRHSNTLYTNEMPK